MRWLFVLVPLLLFLTAPPAHAGCDDAFLGALDPGIGEVLSREALPTEVVEDVEIEIERREVSCVPKESDEACVERVTAEQAGLPGEGQRLVVAIEGPYLGVRTTFRDGEQTFDRDFDSYEDAAAWMEAEQVERPSLALVRAGHRRDPAKRIAAARAVEDREQIRDLGPGIRMKVRLTVPFSEALRAFHAPGAVSVIRWDSDADGTVTVELRCR
jgi:hypothetical protein